MKPVPVPVGDKPKVSSFKEDGTPPPESPDEIINRILRGWGNDNPLDDKDYATIACSLLGFVSLKEILTKMVQLRDELEGEELKKFMNNAQLLLCELIKANPGDKELQKISRYLFTADLENPGRDLKALLDITNPGGDPSLSLFYDFINTTDVTKETVICDFIAGSSQSVIEIYSGNFHNIDTAADGILSTTKPVTEAPLKIKTKTIPDSPKRIARELFENQCILLSKIQPAELVGKSWEKQETQKCCPNLIAYTSYCENISSTVSDMLLKAESKSEQRKLYSMFVDTITECLELKNYSAVGLILAGISSSPVDRLKYLKDSLSDKQAEQLKIAHAILNPSSSYKNYRTKLSELKDKLYIGLPDLLLKDLIFMEDGKTRKLDKIKMVGGVIQEIQATQKSASTYFYAKSNKDPIVKTGFCASISGEHLSPKDAYNKSLEIFPRGASKPVFPKASTPSPLSAAKSSPNLQLKDQINLKKISQTVGASRPPVELPEGLKDMYGAAMDAREKETTITQTMPEKLQTRPGPPFDGAFKASTEQDLEKRKRRLEELKKKPPKEELPPLPPKLTNGPPAEPLPPPPPPPKFTGNK